MTAMAAKEFQMNVIHVEYTTLVSIKSNIYIQEFHNYFTQIRRNQCVGCALMII